MAEADEAQYQVRQGFWLRMARERSGKSQQGAAEHLGLSKKSKSTVSDYENGVTPIPLRSLRRLAAWYGVPLEVFTHPRPTIEEQLDEIVQLAGQQERQGWAEEAGLSRAGDAEPTDGPIRQTA